MSLFERVLEISGEQGTAFFFALSAAFCHSYYLQAAKLEEKEERSKLGKECNTDSITRLKFLQQISSVHSKKTKLYSSTRSKRIGTRRNASAK